MSNFDYEAKWQKRWADSDIYKAQNPSDTHFDATKPSYYVLDMFPYPSGSGLHVGHASGYIGSDIIARRKRMEGYNVLHPMGWDAFGLPAEQYAIQTGQHPSVTTKQNADNFRRQLKLLGLSYDWSREINTSEPDYYRWTQWLFLKLNEQGLVYQKEVPVWWCEDLRTVLANEEVINGRSERGNHPCVRRPLKQWVLRITAYADRLLEDLESLDWPENVKKMQRDWIGRSVGAEIIFPLESRAESICVFTTRPETLYGVSALVLAPEHPLVAQLTSAPFKDSVAEYVLASRSRSERARVSETRAVGGAFLGSYARHPLDSNREIPIYVSDYVLSEYGTGAVMSVPAHDERDHSFARAMDLPIHHVIKNGGGESLDCYPGEGLLQASGIFTGQYSVSARTTITGELERISLGRRTISYKIKDWVFSRQRYWGEPFPLAFAPNGSIVPARESDLPIILPDMVDFTPSEDGSAPLSRVQNWVNFASPEDEQMILKRSTDTMPGWAGSCWYYLRFMDPHNSQMAFSPEAVQYWKQVDLYIGGTAHAVMHLLYARFWHKVFFDLKLVPCAEPFKRLFNQGMVTAFAYRDATGRLVPGDEVQALGDGWISKKNNEPIDRFITKMSKSLGNVVNPDEVIAAHGCDVFRLYSMFIGPLADDKPWTDQGLPGCARFIRRFWSMFHDGEGNIRPQLLAVSSHWATNKNDSEVINRAINTALSRIDDSFKNLNFNVAVAAMMECLNTVYDFSDRLDRSQAETLLKMLSPLCPHVAAELWERIGNAGVIDNQPWPQLNQEALREAKFELVISVNGRPRRRIEVERGTSAGDLEAIALRQVDDLVGTKVVIKVVVVPDRLVNIVIKER